MTPAAGQHLLHPARGIQLVQSTSQQGMSRITIQFDLNQDINVALQQVQTKISQAQKVWGKRPAFNATLDFWDDPRDVYRVRLARGERLDVRVAAGWPNAFVGLTLLSLQGRQPDAVARTARPGRTQRLSYRAPHTGWYAVKLRIARHGGGRYALHLRKSG